MTAPSATYWSEITPLGERVERVTGGETDFTRHGHAIRSRSQRVFSQRLTVATSLSFTGMVKPLMEHAMKDGYDSDTFGTRRTLVSHKTNGVHFTCTVTRANDKKYSYDDSMFSFSGVNIETLSIAVISCLGSILPTKYVCFNKTTGGFTC